MRRIAGFEEVCFEERLTPRRGRNVYLQGGNSAHSEVICLYSINRLEVRPTGDHLSVGQENEGINNGVTDGD